MLPSHNFRTGTWKKKRQSAKDHYSFLMNSTNAQRSIIHEAVSQQLGHAPSNLWGVPIPKELHVPADPDTLHFVMAAAKHPSHEFGRILSSHKKASGWASAFGELVGDGAKAVGRYGKNVAGFVARNGESIRTGIGIMKDLVQTGAAVGQISGLITHKTRSKIDDISAAIHKHSQATKSKPKGTKAGGNFGRILI